MHIQADVLIVGGGVMGTSIAMYCARRADASKPPVVLCERRALGSGSSGRSGAILRQIYADREVAAMARDSLREYASFEARSARSIGFRRTGVLTIAGPGQADWMERIAGYVEKLRPLGIDIRLVDDQEMRSILPGAEIAPGSSGAFEPDGGFVDPKRTVQAFAALAREYGAVTRLGCEVTEIHVEKGRVVGATTTEGRVTTERVVVVAGPWSGGILERIGVQQPLRVLGPRNAFVAMPRSETASDDEKTRGVSYEMDDPGESRATSLSLAEQAARGIHPTIIDLENGIYSRCDPRESRTRVGFIEYTRDEVLEAPDDLDENADAATRRQLRSALAKRMPAYAEQPDAGWMAGWYTLTPDAQAIIGPVPSVEGLFLVTGFSGHGFKLAPMVGEGVSQMLGGKPVSSFDPEFFSPQRFRGEVDWSGAFGL